MKEERLQRTITINSSLDTAIIEIADENDRKYTFVLEALVYEALQGKTDIGKILNNYERYKKL
ncbi:hypothetical protein IX329_000680 [Fusobacterium necrophorum]|nr:hypothetical protein [Fusobacterium necrophorum]MBR8733107.1 hypothetical protein [Fusobacterium necrophorum]MBR8789349.1 hypothetical protein [Fusobacterium necrophorum]MCI7344460.1 hypothetical protein [Fusobacterium necrophorum]